MTGRQRIEAALSIGGTPEIPAVICYEGIYIRDHWEQLTGYPWWYPQAADIERQIRWRREVINKIGQDWFRLTGLGWFEPPAFSRSERQNLCIEVRSEGVFRVDRSTGKEKQLIRPHWSDRLVQPSIQPGHLPQTSDEVDCLIPLPAKLEPDQLLADGRNDLASQLLNEFGADLYPTGIVAAPLTSAFDIFGFQGTMILIATRPDLVEQACRRLLPSCLRTVREAALLGAAGIWIEDCFTDMISPEAFARLNVPFVRHLVEEIRAAGMHSFYYFCGDPEGKWEHLLSVGADALALEESKKGFVIDIEDVVARVDGRCTVLGNLDAVGVLQDGTEEQLRAEIARQIAAGRRNRSRFIMSIGSPVTPGTPAERVRLYCDLVRDLRTL